MSLEEFFIKDYEKVKRINMELEKSNKLLKIEHDKIESHLKEIIDFLSKGQPYDTGAAYGYFSLSYWLNGKERERAIKILKRLGIKIKED